MEPPNNAEGTPKTPSQLKKEAAKAAKLQKLAEKKAKMAAMEAKQLANGGEAKKSKKPAKTEESLTYDVPTARGERKDTSGPLPKSYSPKYVEAAWYTWWEKIGLFKPEFYGDKAKGQFTMVIPPPNVTGSLHLGHALTNSIEDAIVRWHRMKGKAVLWNPGCDHAGIATQVVVEKKLKRERNQTRHDVGREKFVEEVFKWKKEKGDYIYDQLRALGSSVDWDRACFTMDEKMSRAVTEAFVRLHDTGKIYRSTRLVHWSCTLKSAISDIEVEKRVLDGPTMLRVPGYDKPVEFGVFVHFAYRLEGGEEEVCVATTRIETMLGDTAVAVNPLDKRYMHMVGRTIVHPFGGHSMKIVADEHADMELGTGCVKITPAHDHNDYEVGLRHKLPFITVIDDQGMITAECNSPFTGMKRYDARQAIIDRLKEMGLYRGTEKNEGMVVPICSRSKDIVEPMLKPQWYVNCTEMTAKAREVVDNGSLRIIPEMYVKTWHKWMDGGRDWCISRQLWWGHRIPAYFCKVAGKPEGDSADNNNWVSARTEAEAMQRACDRFAVAADQITLRRDEDVLDTWFSSALFPFSVFGWPDRTPDLEKFFPGHLLETGHDILFFWVARMVFFALTLCDQLPFKEVFLHAMVRDAHGRKMSKSLGNVIDPLHVIHGATLDRLLDELANGNLDKAELDRANAGLRLDYPVGIPECGTDAMRFGLCAYTTQGRDINLDVLRIQGYRHFCNKIWQATKLTLMQLGDDFKPCSSFKPSKQDAVMDTWLLSRLSSTVRLCNEAFDTYYFPTATSACHAFWQYDLCDVYLEYTKPIMRDGSEADKDRTRQVLYVCLDTALRLLHPFMPFMTEELWQRLPHDWPTLRDASDNAPLNSICVAQYPMTDKFSWNRSDVDEQVALAMEVVRAARSMRAVYDLQPRQLTRMSVVCRSEQMALWTSQLSAVVGVLSNAAPPLLVSMDAEGEEEGSRVSRPVGDKCTVYLYLKGLIDPVKEGAKLQKKLDRVTESLGRLRDVVDKADYATRVPEEVRNANTDKLSGLTAEHDQLTAAIRAL